MNISGYRIGLAWLLSVGLTGGAMIVGAQQGGTPSSPSGAPPNAQGNNAQTPPAAIRLKIEVTGGDDNKPIENASVYLKTVDQKLLKDKKFEVNVKTNLHGVAHVPDAPSGRVLIQVVATGWKPYGHWYDVTDPQQIIKVHLERPPKWY